MIEFDQTDHISPLADIEDSVCNSRIVVGAYSVIDGFVKLNQPVEAMISLSDRIQPSIRASGLSIMCIANPHG